MHLAGSNPCNGADPDCDGRNERITLLGSTIRNNSAQGWLGASSGSQILYNDFENNGTTAIFDHNIYVSGSGGGQTHGIRVVGNRLYRSALDTSGVCRGVSLVVHGEHDDLRIEGNEIWEDVGFAGGGCWGIAVDNGYGSAEGFTNVVIAGNTVRNVGNLAIGVGACADCTIENNVIVHDQDFGITAIAAPDRSLGAGDLPQDDIVVRNNSIWIGPDSGGTAISVRRHGRRSCDRQQCHPLRGQQQLVQLSERRSTAGCLSGDRPQHLSFSQCLGRGMVEWLRHAARSAERLAGDWASASNRR